MSSQDACSTNDVVQKVFTLHRHACLRHGSVSLPHHALCAHTVHTTPLPTPPLGMPQPLLPLYTSYTRADTMSLSVSVDRTSSKKGSAALCLQTGLVCSARGGVGAGDHLISYTALA